MPDAIIPKNERTYYNNYLKKVIKESVGEKLSVYAIMVSKEVGHHISESKLSKDFKALNIKRVKEGDRWIYKEIIPVVSDEYSVEFYNYICKKPLILRNLECLHIPVIIGSETLVCKKIINHFGRKNKNIFCIPGYACVCVFNKRKTQSSETEPKQNILEEIKEITTAIYKEKCKK